MDVREAVGQAKAYLSRVFEGEDVSQVRLEEVEFDETNDAWLITLGVLRSAPPRGSRLADDFNGLAAERTYKVIRISNRGGQPSIKIRELGQNA